MGESALDQGRGRDRKHWAEPHRRGLSAEELFFKKAQKRGEKPGGGAGGAQKKGGCGLQVTLGVQGWEQNLLVRDKSPTDETPSRTWGGRGGDARIFKWGGEKPAGLGISDVISKEFAGDPHGEKGNLG